MSGSRTKSKVCPDIDYPECPQDVLNHIEITSDGKYLYKGVKVPKVKRKLLGKGTYGEIYEIVMTDPAGTEYSVVEKISTSSGRELEEMTALRMYPNLLCCSDMVPIRVSNGRILMPKADGDLGKFKLSSDVAEKYTDLILDQLLCMLDKGIRYLDLKAENVLYRCTGRDTVEVFLGDVGSVVPNHAHEHAATFPPVDCYQGFVPITVPDDYIRETYKYQCAVLYSYLVLGGFRSYDHLPSFNDRNYKLQEALDELIELLEKKVPDLSQRQVDILKREARKRDFKEYTLEHPHLVVKLKEKMADEGYKNGIVEYVRIHPSTVERIRRNFYE